MNVITKISLKLLEIKHAFLKKKNQPVIYLLSYLKAGFMETIDHFQINPLICLIAQINLKKIQ